MSIKFKELKLNPEQAIANEYNFIRADLKEGLNYGVNRKMYERAMKFFGATPRKGLINSRIYVDDVYKAQQAWRQRERKP